MPPSIVGCLAPYTSLEYQKGKNNVVAGALSRIGEKQLPQEETDEIFKAIPLLEGDPTVVGSTVRMKRIGSLKRIQNGPCLDKMKAVFDNLTMGAGRWAEQEWDQESMVTAKADSIEIEAQAT